MLEAFEYSFRKLCDFFILLEDLVAFQDGDYLIIGFAAVDEAKAADRPFEYCCGRSIIK